MTDENLRPPGLERSRRPTAIVHEGFFVYANPAFLDRLGYKSFEDLESVPLLDLVDDSNHARLREHLDAAKKAAGTDTDLPEARLTLRRADDLPLNADCTAFRTRHAGEDCVQLNLLTREDTNISGQVKNLPWKQYLSILFLILFTVLPSTLLLKLNIDNSPTVYFPADEPAVVLDKELKSRFPSDQVFVLVFKGVALYSDGFLSAYHTLAKSILTIPMADDVISVTTQDHIQGSNTGFAIERLIDTDALDESNPKERRTRIMSDRLSKDVLVSLDGSALAMIVIPKESGNSFERMQFEQDLLESVRQAQLDSYLVAVAGWLPVDVAELRSMLSDNSLFIPATVAIGLLLIWWLFRRKLAVVLAGVAISVVVNSTVAIYVLLDQPFTLVSSIISPMLSALTVAALVHLFNALQQASYRGHRGRERVERALTEVRRPALFAALTTAAGLASLGSSPIIPIKAFGVISACGVVFIYVVVYQILPHIVTRWDHKPWPQAEGGMSALDSIIKVLSRFGLRQPLVVILVSGCALAFGLPQLWNVRVETNFQEYFSAEHKVRQDTNYVDKSFVGTMPLEVALNASHRDGLIDQEILSFIQEFQLWSSALPQVDRTFSLVDFIQEMHWAMNAENDGYRTLPTDTQLISQYLLVYDGNDLYDFVDRDFQHSHVAMNLNVHSANEIADVIEEISGYLQEHSPEHLRWNITGAGRLFADMEDLLVAGQVYSLWGALLLIFFFMLLLWRSVGDAVLCMIPNLSPILLIFVVMGSFGIWLDMATAMIASVAVGIAVDDTIHVFHGFRNRLNNGSTPVFALVRSYHEAGRAVVVTTIILSAQFLILVSSDFVPTRNFGLLTTIGLITALLFDLLLLPALLIIIYGNKSPVAAWLKRLRGRLKKTEPDEVPESGSMLTENQWTPERKITVVKEILSGKATVSTMARDYALPEQELEQWLAVAEAGLTDAFSEGLSITADDPEKIRALAKAYKKLKAENRVLRAGQQR